MRWEHELSKWEIDRVGKVLVWWNNWSQHFFDALKEIHAYRKQHYYPMVTINNSIKSRIKTRSLWNITYTLSQRLKRLQSIILKLTNEDKETDKMQLSRMQDIGGIRIVTKSIGDVIKLSEILSNTKWIRKYQVKRLKNYIYEPSKDGYRGVHIIYNFKDKESSRDFSIELQIRTEIQHIRAMAVETFTMFSGEGIKFRQWDSIIRSYFELVADGFSMLEWGVLSANRKTIPKEKIFCEIKKQTDDLQIIEKLHGFQKIFHSINNKEINSKHKEYILTIDKKNKKLYTIIYKDSLWQDFISSEQDENLISVLVKVDNVKKIKSTYPSYYADTNLFIEKIKEICAYCK